MPWETYDTFTVWSKVTAWVIVISCWLVKKFLCFLEPLLSLVLENPDVPIYRNLFWFFGIKVMQPSLISHNNSVKLLLSLNLEFLQKMLYLFAYTFFMIIRQKFWSPSSAHTTYNNVHSLKVRCLSFMTLSWIQHFVFSHIAMVFHFLQHLLN